MFTLKYRCKFREYYYEEEFDSLPRAIEAGRRRVLQSGTPAMIFDASGAKVWALDP